jgi:hypothetical protein
MAYQVHMIDTIDELEQCELFQIDHFQWVEGYKPKAFGRMGLMKDFGLVISMTAMESEPLTTYTKDNDPVYLDSALEAFFNFTPKRETPYYINFEMNANGAMLNDVGLIGDRKSVFTTIPFRGTCLVSRKADSWSVLLKIPMEMICSIFDIPPLKSGDLFTCNFYKICETKELEHYASYSPLASDIPNFHLPQYFATAIIIEE